MLLYMHEVCLHMVGVYGMWVHMVCVYGVWVNIGSVCLCTCGVGTDGEYVFVYIECRYTL